jgi:ABC-type Fe3+ transport system substrate-binding protein
MLRYVRSFTACAAALLVAAASCGPASSPPAEPRRASSAGATAGGAPGGGAAPTTQTDRLKALIDAARQEGQLNLTWSDNTAGGAEGAQRWLEGFNKAYGLNLSLRFTPGPAMPEMAAKIGQEHQAGRPASSDVFIGSEAHVVSLMREDTLEPVDWMSWASNLQDARLIVTGGAAVELASRTPGITYNSNRVRDSAIPTSLQDVLQPRYKGRIASTTYAANFDRLASPQIWGEQRTVEYVTRLADQVAGLMRCGESDRLVSGEFDLLVTDCGSYEARRQQAKGAPLGHVIPTDGALLNYWYMGVPRNSQHPNAAKLWVNYVMGREGQDILYESDFTDHYLVAGSKSAPEIDRLLAQGVKFTELDVEFVQRNDEKEVARIRSDMQRILQGR